MTKFLQELLTTNEPLFPFALNQLEKTTGNEGVDVRLIADITHRAHDIMRTLGLDPADTTARELYLALNAYSHQSNTQEIFFEADFVLIRIENDVVSFNLIDVVENAHHELAFEKRIITHGQRSLRGEIVTRYSDHPRTDEAITQQLALDAGLLLAADQGHTKPDTTQIETQHEDKMMQPYLLAVGDIVTDAFIKLKDDEARIDVDEQGNKRLSMEFGNKPPYDHVDIVQAVGNSANAAVSFSRLGLRGGLMAYLGDDQPGKDSLDYLATEQVVTDTVSVQTGFKSNYHYALRYGADRTILIKYEDYDYAWQEPTTVPDWIYLSMISESAWQLHEDLMGYLNNHSETKLVFQPGTFHFKWGTQKLAEIYKRSHIVFMNREEAALVTGLSRESVPELLNGLHGLGVNIAVVTDGPDGAYASDGTKMLSMPNYPDPAEPYDRTGAGDAFASTITAAIAGGESLETALLWAPINSMSVVQKLGAQAGLLHKDELQKYLDEAPEWYHTSELQA